MLSAKGGKLMQAVQPSAQPDQSFFLPLFFVESNF
jgi:hypothetical protein